MGAWRFVREQFLDGGVREHGGASLRYVGREASASPGAGIAQGPRGGAGGDRRGGAGRGRGDPRRRPAGGARDELAQAT